VSEVAVTNSTCLIGLERIGRLEILPQVFSSIFIPLAVQQEVGINADWPIVQSVANLALIAALKTQLDPGEAEAIALAIELGDVFLIIDERNARRIAQQMGLKVIGTLGMLLRAKEKGVISEVKPVIMSLESVNFRIAPALIQKALILAGEL
jgi:predicted nucleic acid-binding protein